VTSYNIQWATVANAAAGTWTDLAGLTSDYTDAVYIVTSGVTAGTPYVFRVRAANAHGWGAFSPEVTVAASTYPD
jgi:hypothetical protein